MPREYRQYFDDIIEAGERIAEYTSGMDEGAFREDRKTQDAVIRNLAIIGEAARSLPPHVRNQAPAIEWRKIIGLRNILIHEYSGVNIAIIWDVITNHLPKLTKEVKSMLKNN
jgi:uncharacterized protein with HEPN domain